MPLTIALDLTTGDTRAPIETLTIARLTRLHPGKPDNQRHSYVATRRSPAGDIRAQAEFTHRYGDGAWVCTMRALMALALESRREGANIRDYLQGFDLDDEPAILPGARRLLEAPDVDGPPL